MSPGNLILDDGIQAQIDGTATCRERELRWQMAKLLEAWDGFDSVQRFPRKYGNLKTLWGNLADLNVYFRWLPSVGASLNPDELVRDDLKCVYESSATDVGFKRRRTDLLGLYVKVHLMEKGWMSLQGTGRSRPSGCSIGGTIHPSSGTFW